MDVWHLQDPATEISAYESAAYTVVSTCLDEIEVCTSLKEHFLGRLACIITALPELDGRCLRGAGCATASCCDCHRGIRQVKLISDSRQLSQKLFTESPAMTQAILV